MAEVLNVQGVGPPRPKNKLNDCVAIWKTAEIVHIGGSGSNIYDTYMSPKHSIFNCLFILLESGTWRTCAAIDRSGEMSTERTQSICAG